MALFYLLVIGFGRLLWQAGQIFRKRPGDTYWEDGENTTALDSAY